MFENNTKQMLLKQYFIKAHFDGAYDIFSNGTKIDFDIVEGFVEALQVGLGNSVEVNKYQAISNLIEKASIKIQNLPTDVLYSVRDDIEHSKFSFLNGVLDKLGHYYIGLSQWKLQQTLSACDSKELRNQISQAFKAYNSDRLSNFQDMKKLCPQSKDLRMVSTEFDAYFYSMGKALNIFDNDFTLEVLTINGLRPTSLEEDVIVFRGLSAKLTPDSWFKFGTRGFSNGAYQKFLGYYVNEPWNEAKGKWELGGTYVSLSAASTSNFAYRNNKGADCIVIEMKLPKGSPKICGSWYAEFELVPSTIDGQDIVALYTVFDRLGNIKNVLKNPYIDDKLTPQYQDSLLLGDDGVKTYNQLGCKEQPHFWDGTDGYSGPLHGHSALYKNYEDFISRYTPDIYMQDQKILFDTYFADRPSYYDLSEPYVLSCQLLDAEMLSSHCV